MQAPILVATNRHCAVNRIDRETSRLSMTILIAVFAAGMAAMSAGAADLSEARARYQQDRATCLNGTANQDRATCLREAGAALEEAKRGQVDHEDEAVFEKNRLVRCDPLPPGDRQDCLRRMRGEGTVSGSVEAGGIYRELVTIVPAQPPR